jgi:SNF2 family DNA or RNA helicase
MPAPNGLEDLWAQVYLLDRGERLGRYITHYRQRYFDHNPWRHEYVPKPGAFEAVQKRISDICVSMKAEDWLQLPELVTHDMPVALDPQAEKVYRRMEREAVMEIGEDEEISATSAAALTGKLLQLCGGAVYDEAGEVHHVHDAKLDALCELIEQLHGQHALVYYNFKHDKDRLMEVLSKSKLRVREFTGAAEEIDWNAGKIDVLLAHPASTAYGLNLQDGGHHIIWFGLNWSLELYQQANKRLHRQGQKAPVIIHRLICTGTRDEDLAEALGDKAASQEKVLESLKARIKKWRLPK